MAQYFFGAGTLWATQLQDANGANVTLPTPVQLGTMQDVTIDITAESKKLYGNLQFPVAVAAGKKAITGKAKFADIKASVLNTIVFGQTLASGLIANFIDAAGALVPAAPYQITVTPPSSGTFVRDLGVRDEAGKVMTRVASAPATGQYTVTAGGQYTFAAADTGKRVYIEYEYSATVVGAQKQTVLNLPMGYTPIFRANFTTAYQGKLLTLNLFNCVATKLTLATKQDDFGIPELDFDAFANANGQAFDWSTSE